MKNIDVGSLVIIDQAEYLGVTWLVKSVRNIKIELSESTIKMSDFNLESDDSKKKMVLRHVGKNMFIALEPYYPADGDVLPWCDESPLIIEAANDPTGVFYNNRGQDNEEEYRRIGGIIPLLGTATFGANRTPVTIWDFFRSVENLGVKEEQFLYVELSGHFDNKTNSVDGGSKTINIMRGLAVSRIRVI